jgi:endonuclease/exonuclease/phosphatase family metal-dependent hydrolase
MQENRARCGWQPWSMAAAIFPSRDSLHSLARESEVEFFRRVLPMLSDLESLFHRLRRRFSRSEWAIRRLGFTTSEGTGESPGLLLVQIDGLSRRQMERAVAEGRMPFLRDLQRRNGYETRTFYPGMPSTTPAVQAEFYYGVRAAVPAFQFKDRARGAMVSMFEPARVREIEEKLAAQAPGLLEGGCSWSNIYRGGARASESHFCISALGFGETWRTPSKFPALVLFGLMQTPALVRIAFLLALEFLLGLGDAMMGILRGRPPLIECGMLLSRMCVGIGLREVLTVGAKVDLARGLPIVHVNFLGYDEASHCRGPGSAFAHWTLRGIDHAIRLLYRAAHESRRRDYQVWVFSDHGQERAHYFAGLEGRGIEGTVAHCLELLPPAQRRPIRPVMRPLFERGREAAQSAPKDDAPEFEVSTMGPVAHLYLRDAVDLEALASRLVSEGVPGVLRRTPEGGVIWHRRAGNCSLPEGAGPALASHPSALREELANDLVALCRHENAGDLVLLGWDADGEPRTFSRERGSHAGPGAEELQGFLLVPPGTEGLPAGEFVRPTALRAAALLALRQCAPARAAAAAHAPARLRVMSYNVHSCIGCDGRVSPRRIARLIAQQAPDIVALQEVEHGRARSRGEHQAERIAEALGYHLAFCPVVVADGERYGHAVLSRFPLETVKLDFLPAPARSWWPEPRAALWTRLALGDFRFNLLTTHLGLSAEERLRQAEALVGPEWIGAVPGDEPVILCGDFNFLANSAPHRVVRERLRDAAHFHPHRLRTFPAARPLVQIDHLFLSGHFAVETLAAVRNDLSRVASDHLPLVADLRIARS